MSAMRTYPVHYTIEPPPRFTRLQLLIRLLAFCVIGMVGLSFGAVLVVGFIALPVFAAMRLSSRDHPNHPYVVEDGPRVIAVLRWFAALSAWAGLIAEHVPSRSPDETVRVEVEASAHPTPRSALFRLLSGLPSAFALFFLSWIGMIVWLWAALSILFTERVGPGAFNYLAGLQRWSIRLLVYQASLVDEYPPFSFSDLVPAVSSWLRRVATCRRHSMRLTCTSWAVRRREPRRC
jgi:hypothetical protein